MYQTFKRFALRLLPEKWVKTIEPSIRKSLTIVYQGGNYQCPVCQQSFRKFIPISNDVGFADELCPSCGSIKRMRLQWLFLHHELNIDYNLWTVLDFSPHRALSTRLCDIVSINYISTDYETAKEDRRYDITLLPEPDQRFHLVICYHVLEHIPDDEAAMKELYRITRPGGYTILQVPFHEGATKEDPAITSPEERLAHFGQEDHVRLYGRKDFSQRLRNVGFEVKERRYAKELGEEAIEHYRLNPDEVIFVARRPQD
ncbi:MAG: class I SAM-dependent methyltransferase [Salibacteraceae bacterium]